MHPTSSPGPQHRPTAAPRPPTPPQQARLTDRLLYRWEHLRAEQQHAAWAMVETMRTSLARDRRRQRLLGALVLLGVAADAVLMYVVLHAPGW